jgi:Nif-specific regulatory protein
MTSPFSHEDTSPASREFLLLHEISAVLTSSLDLKDTLSLIFEMLDEQLFLKKSVLTLYNKADDTYSIDLEYGVSTQIMNGPIFAQWETINRTVLENGHIYMLVGEAGELVVLGDHTPEQLREEIFICIPISLADHKMGVLSVNALYEDEATLYQKIRLFRILALMVAQELKLKSLLEVEQSALKAENKQLKGELKEKYNIHNMIGKSNRMIKVYEEIKQVAKSHASVLISGESGTGKELVAHAIHYSSDRETGPFIKLNCGAIPESLIESELFGYEKGAFTDAQERRIGKFEAANGGTVFLDEVGELTPAIQVKLLRVLQEKEFTRVGGIAPVRVNVRIVAASNKDLEKEMNEGHFRKDLFYRLNVFPISLPALRERRSDILLLVEHFLSKFSNENGKDIQRLAPLARDLLKSYYWPGNVRELENCMERAVLVCDSTVLESIHLPPSLQKVDVLPASIIDDVHSLEMLVQQYERNILIDALICAKGNKSKAARMLQTTQRILSYKIDALDIKVSKIKSQVKGL